MTIVVEFNVELNGISEDDAVREFFERYFDDTPSILFDENWEIIIKGFDIK